MKAWFNKKTKYDTVPFGRFTATKLLNAFRQDLKKGLSDLSALEASTETPTFFNTILELETIYQESNRFYDVFYTLLSTVDTKFIHFNTRIDNQFSRFEKKFYSNSIFKKVEYVYQNYDANLLTNADIALIKSFYKTFMQCGSSLGNHQYQEFMKIEKKFRSLGSSYQRNILNTQEKNFKVKKIEQLRGVSEQFFKTSKKNKKNNGFSLSPTDNTYVEVMENAKNRNIREKIYNIHYNTIQNKYLGNNEKIARDIFKLRKDKAKMLGYDNYLQLVLEQNSVGGYKNLSSMLSQLTKAAKPKVDKILKEMSKLAQKDGINSMEAWDISYYLKKFLESKFKINKNKLDFFFPLVHVKKELFAIINEIFGIKLTKIRVASYHKDVEVYKVTKGNKYLGLLYLDLYERSHKDSAFCRPIVTHGFNRKPHMVVATSVLKPKKGETTFLKIQDLFDLFHEMGHAIHMLASETEYPETNGFGVSADFSEVPSLFFEKICFQESIFKRLSNNYQTKKPLTDKMVSDVLQMRRIEDLFSLMKNLRFAKLDIEAHRASPTELRNFTKFESKVLKNNYLSSNKPGQSFLSNFEHIFNSEYECAYYSYLWSDVIAEDICRKFLAGKNNIINKAVANKFYKEVLSQGASQNELKLYKNFKGSPVSIHPFLKALKKI
jgi:Zn-dependent oligopeptidase